MAPKKLLSILLQKNDGHIPWGFSVAGGREIGLPVIIDQVHPGTLSCEHLQEGDIILKIDNIDCSSLSLKNIEHCIHGKTKALDLLVWKNPEDMVRLIKKKNVVLDENHDNDYHKDKLTDNKFELKYPHQFLDDHKLNQKHQNQRPCKSAVERKSNKNKTFAEIVENIVQERREASESQSHVSTENYSDDQISNSICENSSNVVGRKENGDENELSNNVVYNNVKFKNRTKIVDKTENEQIHTVQNTQFQNSCINNLSSITTLRDEQPKKMYNTNTCSDTHSYSTNQNVCHTKKQLKTNETYMIEEKNSRKNTKLSPSEFDFEPLAHSTLLKKPSDRENKSETPHKKKEKEDEDDIDAQFTKYYQNMIESKQQIQDAKFDKPKSPDQNESSEDLKSNVPLFNQNYQSKIEEHKRITRSSERVISEAKKEIKQLVQKDFSNAEWSGQTEVYTSQSMTQNVKKQENETSEIDFIDNNDDDVPYNELEKNPLFNRLRNIEEQIERCMTPERLEKETQFNTKFEEYYKEKVSKNNLMNSRWHAKGKQHSEENLHTPSKPIMLKPQERLTDPRGVFFKKRYEECVISSINSLDEKRTTGFNYSKTGFNNSRKFWMDMEKKCPGNSSEFRPYFVKLQDKFNEKPSKIMKEAKVVEPVKKSFSQSDKNTEKEQVESIVQKEVKALVQEVHEPVIIPKHVEYDRSKTPVGFYDNKKPKLKVEVPKLSIEKIQSFALARNEDRKLWSPVAENLEKIIASNSSSRRSSKNGDTPPNENVDDIKKQSDYTFRTITPNPSGNPSFIVRPSGGLTPTSPFYYDKLKESPVFMGIKMKIAEENDCKRCSICGEEADCDGLEDLEYITDVLDVEDGKGVFEDAGSPVGCCAHVKLCNE